VRSSEGIAGVRAIRGSAMLKLSRSMEGLRYVDRAGAPVDLGLVLNVNLDQIPGHSNRNNLVPLEVWRSFCAV